MSSLHNVLVNINEANLEIEFKVGRFLSPNVKFTNSCFQIQLFLDTLGFGWEGRLFP